MFFALVELCRWRARESAHHDRFVHPLGNHFAHSRLPRRASVFRRQWRWLRRRLSILCCLLGHKLFLLLRLRFCGGGWLWGFFSPGENSFWFLPTPGHPNPTSRRCLPFPLCPCDAE